MVSVMMVGRIQKLIFVPVEQIVQIVDNETVTNVKMDSVLSIQVATQMEIVCLGQNMDIVQMIHHILLIWKLVVKEVVGFVRETSKMHYQKLFLKSMIKLNPPNSVFLVLSLE